MTIHADTPEGVIDQLAMLASHGFASAPTAMMVHARSVIDIVVQLYRTGGLRSVSRVF